MYMYATRVEEGMTPGIARRLARIRDEEGSYLLVPMDLLGRKVMMVLLVQLE